MALLTSPSGSLFHTHTPISFLEGLSCVYSRTVECRRVRTAVFPPEHFLFVLKNISVGTLEIWRNIEKKFSCLAEAGKIVYR